MIDYYNPLYPQYGGFYVNHPKNKKLQQRLDIELSIATVILLLWITLIIIAIGLWSPWWAMVGIFSVLVYLWILILRQDQYKNKFKPSRSICDNTAKIILSLLFEYKEEFESMTNVKDFMAEVYNFAGASLTEQQQIEYLQLLETILARCKQLRKQEIFNPVVARSLAR